MSFGLRQGIRVSKACFDSQALTKFYEQKILQSCSVYIDGMCVQSLPQGVLRKLMEIIDVWSDIRNTHMPSYEDFGDQTFERQHILHWHSTSFHSTPGSLQQAKNKKIWFVYIDTLL